MKYRPPVPAVRRKEKMTATLSASGNFFKLWTIANTVWTIINNFVVAGGPSVNASVVAIEASKDLKRRVEQGFLKPSILVDHEALIQEAIDNHPLIQNRPVDIIEEQKV